MRIIPDGIVIVAGGRVQAVGAVGEIEWPENASALDAHGGVIVPGFVNAHHHTYSALARGMSLELPVRNFVENLQRRWWRLDRALDEEAVRVSAALTAAACVRAGCTTVFDHHASPSCIDGSLDILAEVWQHAGLRGVFCYEVTDRNGTHQARQGIAENRRFAEAHIDDPAIGAMMGLHAAFTLRTETLQAAREAVPKGIGCHIHVAEDAADVEACRHDFGKSPIARLRETGWLNDRALVIHGVHLAEDDLDDIGTAGATLIHNPESNANNAVGHLDLRRAMRHIPRIGLGTDGMSSNILGSLRAAFLLHRAATEDPTTGFDVAERLLDANFDLANRHLPGNDLGTLTPGAAADIVVIDQIPPTPFNEETAWGHLLYGFTDAAIRHTVCQGRVLMRDFELTTLDLQALSAQACEIAPNVWERVREFSPETPFLG